MTEWTGPLHRQCGMCYLEPQLLFWILSSEGIWSLFILEINEDIKFAHMLQK
jgi:hypothetical protein